MASTSGGIRVDGATWPSACSVLVGIEDVLRRSSSGDAAVAALLALTVRRRGLHKFNVELAIAEEPFA